MKWFWWLGRSVTILPRMKDIILNQWKWKEWECSGFAILWALARMKDVDYEKIAHEIIEETWNSASLMNAKAWFIKKWYIKNMTRVAYSPIILIKKPIITSFRGVDWVNTRIAPYKIQFLPWEPKNAHYMAIVAPWKLANSWWRWFWDNWYCYFQKEDLKRCTQFFVINI